MSATVAIVWPCPCSVEEYQAAGRGVPVPRVDCPDCGQPMGFWSGYQRYLRDGCGRIWRVWVARAKCRLCGVTHALLPSFVLLGRFDVVWVIGPALERAAAGGCVRWRRGSGCRTPPCGTGGAGSGCAPVLVAGLCALVVEFGGLVDGLSGVAERAVLAALQALAARVAGRLGGAAPAIWPLAGIVSGGGWLGTTTSPPWAGGGRTGWLPPVPRPPPA